MTSDPGDERRTFAPDIPLEALRWAARSAGLLGVGLFVATLLTPDDVKDADDWVRWVQLALFGVGAAGFVVALRFEGVGASLMLIAGAGLLLLATVQGDPLASLFGAAAFGAAGILTLVAWRPSRPLPAFAGVLAITCAVAFAGGYGAHRVHDHYLGPTHPESPLEAPTVHIVEWVWSGAVSESGATVKAKLAHDFDDVRLEVTDGESFETAEAVEGEQSDRGIATFLLTELAPDTEYFYAVVADGVREQNRQGSFRTFPEGPASFTFAVAACARSGSNGSVFETMLEHDPLFYVMTGDAHYENIESNNTGRFHEAFDELLSRPAQAALYQQTPVAYAWDDHDFGASNADSTSASRPAAREAYGAVVPHYPLVEEGGATYQAFDVGRVRFLVTDSRYHRTPSSDEDGPTKTMLGEAQKEWLERELLAARDEYALIVWVNSAPWIDAPTRGEDTWGSFATERAEISGFIEENGIENILMLSGEAHMLAIDDGTNAEGGFPVFHAAALDKRGAEEGGPYSEGMFPGGGQFGLVTVEDDGRKVRVTLSGRNYRDEEVVGYQFVAGEN